MKLDLYPSINYFYKIDENEFINYNKFIKKIKNNSYLVHVWRKEEREWGWQSGRRDVVDWQDVANGGLLDFYQKMRVIAVEERETTGWFRWRSEE